MSLRFSEIMPEISQDSVNRFLNRSVLVAITYLLKIRMSWSYLGVY